MFLSGPSSFALRLLLLPLLGKLPRAPQEDAARTSDIVLGVGGDRVLDLLVVREHHVHERGEQESHPDRQRQSTALCQVIVVSEQQAHHDPARWSHSLSELPHYGCQEGGGG